MAELVSFGSSGWRYLQVALDDTVDRSAPGFDDSSWATGSAPFSDSLNAHGATGFLTPATAAFPQGSALWLRRVVSGLSTSGTLTVRYDDGVDVYWNGTLLASEPTEGHSATITVPISAAVTGSDLLAIHASDGGGPANRTYIDVEIVGVTSAVSPALRGRQRGDGLGSSSAPRGRQTGSRQASLRGRAFI